MKASRWAAATLATVSIGGQALAAPPPPPPPPCVTPAEVRAGLAFIVPTLLTGLKTKCVPVLPSNAFMTSRGNDFQARFKTTASQNPDALRSAIKKVIPDVADTLNLPGALDLVASGVTEKMQADIKPAVCPKIDAALSLLEPLPAENIIGLLEIAVTEMANEKKRGAAPKVSICAGPSAQ